MRITYDFSVDAAYIYLVEIGPGEATQCDDCAVGNFDFNEDGKLIGIEVLNASKRLPSDLLAEADIIG